MSDNNDFGSFFAGFMIGGLVGAAVALLLAPQSGEETRLIIRDKSIELKDKAVETGQDAQLRAQEVYQEARTQADSALEDLRVRTDELVRVAKEKASDSQLASLAKSKAEADEQIEVEDTEDSGDEATGPA